MKITLGEIEHVAKLSRIKLSEDEISQYCRELEKILAYFSDLEKAPIQNIKYFEQISGLENVSRADEIKPSLPAEKVLGNAPEKEENFIKTKQIFE